jgi:hypothetical protein
VVQALQVAAIIVAVMALTAAGCGPEAKQAPKVAESPAVREAVEAAGRWLSGEAQHVNEGQAIKLGQEARVAFAPADVRAARQALVSDGDEVARALAEANPEGTLADHQQALQYVCKVYKGFDPQATEEERAQALAGLLPFDPGTEAGARKIKDVTATLTKIHELWTKSEYDRAEVWTACLAVGA